MILDRKTKHHHNNIFILQINELYSFFLKRNYSQRRLCEAYEQTTYGGGISVSKKQQIFGIY